MTPVRGKEAKANEGHAREKSRPLGLRLAQRSAPPPRRCEVREQTWTDTMTISPRGYVYSACYGRDYYRVSPALPATGLRTAYQ